MNRKMSQAFDTTISKKEKADSYIARLVFSWLSMAEEHVIHDDSS